MQLVYWIVVISRTRPKRNSKTLGSTNSRFVTIVKNTMRSLVALVAIGAVAVSSFIVLSAAASDDRKPVSCSNTLGPVTFDSFQHVCAVVHNDKMYDKGATKMSLENRLDIVETCSCALVNRDFAWASMMSHEAEAMHLAIEKFIDETDQYLADINGPESEDKREQARVAALKEQFEDRIQIKSEVSKADLMLAGSNGKDGEHEYYWNRLNQIINDDKDENQSEKVSNYMHRSFAQVVYETDDMSYKLAKTVRPNSMLVSRSVREKLSRTCWLLLRDFQPFMTYFQRLSNLAENPRMFFMLMTYNNLLYKLGLNTLMCEYLESKRKLTSKDEVLKKHRVEAAKSAPKGRSNLKSRRYVESDSEDESDDDDDDDGDDYVKGVSSYDIKMG